jgi:DivIVA domain-containing protein
MSDDRRLTIGSTSRVSADEVARHTFATARRGFDTAEVRAYLEMLAREIHAFTQRERELLDALADAEHRASNPVLDDSTLTNALGQETARVLKTAHDAAAELLSKAGADAAQARAQVEEERSRLVAGAEQQATEVQRRAHEEATIRLESAEAEAKALLEKSRAECRAMVHEAQELRARVLSDLTRRRRALHGQIEQLRAGRQRLAETIGGVRRVVDEVTGDLSRAEDEARRAAEEAGRHAAAQDDVDEAAELAPAALQAPPDVPAGVSPVQAASPAAEEPAAEEPAADGEPSEDRHQAVEELFARLRAEQEPLEDEGVRVLGPVPPGEATAHDTRPRPASVAVADRPAPAEADVAPPQDAAAPSEGPGEAPEAEDPRLGRRDELLKPATSALARRLKRALQDDQNDVLDRLRAKGRFGPDVLPPAEEHERRFRESAEEPLAQAARAGAEFACAAPARAVPADATAAALARDIVGPLRRRLLEEDRPADEGDETALTEHVGAAFREWKGRRVERLAADHAHSAFSRSVLAATAKGASVEWLVDDEGAQCPDCDDNALAGAQRPGEPFPTGHLHPPAHPGCRCLLVPGPA